ncbi:MAG: alkaline phosphatase family protein [Planctomycetota bacterium]|nr:MAG: alkaline phosphatase family protein [Planctomycetota bacterium]
MASKGNKKLLIIDVAALGYDFVTKHSNAKLIDLEFKPIETVFPALTCTVQASFRTAALPSEHGMVANGLFHRDLRKVMFWEQSSRLVKGERFWKRFRQKGGGVGMLFWQQSLGEDVNIALSPAPIHTHGGGMIQDCYGKPANLYSDLSEAVGRKFKLKHYWGPLASVKAGDWISSATEALLNKNDLAPELCMVYLPTLDYDLQRYGPKSEKAKAALQKAAGQLERTIKAAKSNGYEVIVFGDYAIASVEGEPVYPNRALADAGLLKTRRVKKMLYADLYASSAFAVADHEIAHVYVGNQEEIEKTKRALSELNGVAEVVDRAEMKTRGLDHPHSGELLIVAGEGRWFAYPWWKEKREAPDYATHIDIHNKPGYDPSELFFGWPPWNVSQNHSRIRGSHGKIGPDRKVCFASTISFPDGPSTIIELASEVKRWLED